MVVAPPAPAAQPRRGRRLSRSVLARPVRAEPLLVAAFFVAAFALRVWGVSWSLPYVIHVDEPKVVDSAVHIVKTGDLNPHLFIWPSLVIYYQALIDELNLLWGTWRGYYAGPASLPDSNHIFALAPDLYLWGRAVSAAIGAATVAGCYALGRALFARPAGLVAGLLLLASPIQIEYSHYLVTDVTVGACGLLALAAAWRLAGRPSRRAAILAGAAIGLTAAAKYNGVYIAIPVATALLLAWRRPIQEPATQVPPEATQGNSLSPPRAGEGSGERSGSPPRAGEGLGERSVAPPRAGEAAARLGWTAAPAMGLAALAVFLITNPYVVLDWRAWSSGFLFQVRAYLPAQTLEQVGTAFGKQVAALWTTDTWILGMGLLGSVILLIDAVRTGARHPARARAAALLLPFPLLYTGLMSRFTEVYERNLIITLPFLALAGGYGSARLLALLLTHRRSPIRNPRYLTAAALVLGLGLAVEPVRRMVEFDRYMAGAESRNLAAAWLQSELQAGHRAAVELHPWQLCAPPPHACVAPDVYTPNTPLTAHPPAWYAARGYDEVLLVGADLPVTGYPGKPGPHDAAQLAPYLALPALRVFPGDPGGDKGPPVRVVRIAGGLSGMAGVTRSGARYGDLAELWGYAIAPLPVASATLDPAGRVARPPYHPGAAVGVNLYWRALPGHTAPGNWTVALHLLSPTGDTAAQVDVQPISSGRIRPAAAWYPNEFLAGAYNIPLPPGLAAGTYYLTLALYDAPAGRALPVTLPNGAAAPVLDLGAVPVAR